MNLLAGGTAIIGRASGFSQQGMHSTRPRGSRVITLAQTSLRNHHEPAGLADLGPRSEQADVSI
jgi:hypothetical protein